MLSSDALNAMRVFLLSKIAAAAYVVDDTEHTAAIQNAVVLEDGRIEASFIIDCAQGAAVTVTEVRLYDQNNVLLVSKAETITQESTQESILYRFAFTILEAT